MEVEQKETIFILHFESFGWKCSRTTLEPWDTTELCKTVSLEKSQFYSCYQKFFQSTPHADLLQIRMDKAKNLLTNEALTVQQIAQMCGFSDFSHFSRYFRKQAGCSPLQWRRKMGEPH
ncbi:MAG: helix-turn-helix transcriptional regulator [Blautia faecis]